MYTPKTYRNENREELMEFISKNGFGILINKTSDQLTATHIPLTLSYNSTGENVLQGHISRGNSQWKNFTQDDDVLVIFQGPHTYISSSWYDHENVPTWNYVAVHVYGKIKILEGDALVQSLKLLTDKYEAKSKNPISIEKMSKRYFEKELKGLVGFEIRIQDIQAAYKLSQNRDEKNYNNIIHELENQEDENAQQVAKLMRERADYKK